MQQRLGLGVALLGDPDLVLLDEPTSALDPVGRTDVRAIVRAARDRGATVILNSHLLTEVERVCDRVVILDHGRIIASGSLDEVVASDGVRLRVTDLGEAGRAAAAGFGPVTLDGDWLSVRPLAADRIPDLVAALVAAGGRVHAVEPGRGSLEARFLELLAEPAEDGAVIVIARLTVKELVRRRVVWVLAILTLRLGRARRLGPGPPRRRWPARRAPSALEIQIGVSQVLILIAFMFSFVLAMTAAFVGAPAIGGDLESGVAYAILARPLRRADLLLGRWLGSAVVVAAYAAASGLLAIARRGVRERLLARPTRRWRSRSWSGEALVLLTLTLALGSVLPSIAAGAIAVVGFGLGWMAGVLAGVGGGARRGGSRVRSPRRAAGCCRPTACGAGSSTASSRPLVVLIAAGRAPDLANANPFYAATPPPLPFVIWSIVWMALVLGAATWWFDRRDL